MHLWVEILSVTLTPINCVGQPVVIHIAAVKVYAKLLFHSQRYDFVHQNVSYF